MNLNQLIRHAADLQGQLKDARDSVTAAQAQTATVQQKLATLIVNLDSVTQQYRDAKMEIKALLAAE